MTDLDDHTEQRRERKFSGPAIIKQRLAKKANSTIGQFLVSSFTDTPVTKLEVSVRMMRWIFYQ